MDATNYNSLRQALGDIRAEQVRSIVSDYAGKVSKTTLFNNRFYDPDQEKVKQFVSDMGFDLEMIPMKQYIPESVYSLNELSADALQCVSILNSMI